MHQQKAIFLCLSCHVSGAKVDPGTQREQVWAESRGPFNSFQLGALASALYSHHEALPEFAGLGFCWARRTGFHQITPRPQTDTALLIKPFRAALRDRGRILRIF